MSTENETAGQEPADTAIASDGVDEDAERVDLDDDDGVLYEDQVEPEHGVLGMTLRELLIVGLGALALIVSFFPVASTAPVWNIGLDWVLSIGVPTAAVFLIVLRRFSPDGIRRVGSLGIDQFASVAFSVAAVFWAATVWEGIAVSISFGVLALGWVPIVQQLLMLALVVLTVFAPFIPGLREDFHGRLATLAHRNANPVRPVIARPKAPKAPDNAPDAHTASAASAQVPQPYGQPQSYGQPQPFGEAVPDGAWTAPVYGREAPGWAQTPAGELDIELSGLETTDDRPRAGLAASIGSESHASGGDTGTTEVIPDGDYTPGYARGQQDDFDESRSSQDTPVETSFASQPFWALAPTERDVHDEHGQPVFRIGPLAWALVIEDRGGAYVIRHDDGRIGYLHDISDMTKG